MKNKNDKGFTLIELIIVVAILAILVGILAPQYMKYVEKSRKAADVTNLQHLTDSISNAVLEDYKGTWGATLFPYDTTFAFVIWNENGDRPTEFKRTSGKVPAYDSSKFSSVSYVGDEKDIMNEIFGEGWYGTKLKSKKWAVNGASFGSKKYIWVTCYITNQGSLEINYCPTVQEYLQAEN